MVNITIITPFFNCEKTILKHYDYHKSLTYKLNCEIIYVNDCSTDNSYKILKKKINSEKRKNINIYSLNKNHGPGIARNLAITKSQGNYLIFLDSDDKLDLKIFQKIFIKTKKNKSDIFFLGYKKKNNPQINLSKYKFNKKTLIEKYLRTELDMNPNFYIFRKNLILNNKIFFKKGFYEDIPFVLKCFFFSKKFNSFTEKLYIKNNHKGSITNTFTERHVISFINSSKEKFRFFNSNMKSKFPKYFEDNLQYGLRGDYCFVKKNIVKSKLKKKYQKKIINFYKKLIGPNFTALTHYDKIVKEDLFSN